MEKRGATRFRAPVPVPFRPDDRSLPRLIDYVRRALIALICLLASFAASGQGIVDGPLDHWVLRYPPADGYAANEYHGVAFGANGATVVVGIQGAIESFNYGQLVSRRSGVTNSLNAVTFGSGFFLAVGDEGTVLASTDTASWTNLGPITAKNLFGVVWGEGLFVTVGDRGIILTSPDSIHWNPVVSGTTNTLRAVCFAGGAFVAVGSAGTILSSTNGLDWENCSLATGPDLRGVGYGGIENRRYAAVGENGTLLVSSNRIAWEPRDSGTTARLNAVTGSGGSIMVVGDGGTALTSINDQPWAPQNVVGRSFNLLGVSVSNLLAVAVGADGAILRIYPGQGLQNWGNLGLGVGTIKSVAYGNGTFVAVGGEWISLTTLTGENWFSRSRGTGNYLEGVFFGQGQFYAGGIEVGFQGAYTSALIYASDDGIVWSGRARIELPGINNSFVSITQGGGTLVAVGGSGRIATSQDGTVWVDRLSPTNVTYRSVAYGNGRFVAVALATAIESQDGITWSLRSLPAKLLGISFGSGLFVGVGGNGAILTSETGENWTPRDSGTTNHLLAVVHGNGVFVAVGKVVLSSTNGIDWTPHPVPSTDYLTSVAYGGGSFVAVGNGNTIIQSDPILPRVRGAFAPETEGFRLTIEGGVDSGARLQLSGDLAHWQDLFTFTNAEPTASYLDTLFSYQSNRFYRVRMP
jgi:hypothetical protein